MEIHSNAVLEWNFTMRCERNFTMWDLMIWKNKRNFTMREVAGDVGGAARA